MKGSLPACISSQGRSFRVVISVWALLVCVLGGRPLVRVVAQEDCALTWQEQSLDELSPPAEQVTLAVDVANNVYIARILAGKLQLRIIGSGFETDLPIDNGSGAQGDPAVETSSAGFTFVSFSQSTSGTPELGREVFLAKSSGGSFGTPRNLSRNRVDDYAAQLALDARGEPHLVWAQRVGALSRIVYWSGALEQPKVVAEEGDTPSLVLDGDDRVHVAYLRGNDVAYTSGVNGMFDASVGVTSSPFVPESSVSIGVDPAGTVLILYESKGGLYLSTRSSGDDFDPQRLLEAEGVLDPRMRVTPRGKVLIGYSKSGDLFHIFGETISLGEPERITQTGAVESRPSLSTDENGTVHVAFIRDAVVYYSNNACAPLVDFSAVPRTGRVPFTVQFTDLSTRGAERWEWDFGDGEFSSTQNPEHVYNDPGGYTVRLKVSAPGGVTSTKEIEDFIVVEDPINSLRIPDQQVLPGAKGIWFPVIATHVEAIQGFQLMGTYDPKFLQLVRSDFDLTAIATHRLTPEFIETRVFETHFEIGSLFDVSPPFEGATLPPSDELRLINLIFDVSSDAPQGETTRVRLVNDKRISRIFNIFVVDGFRRLPALKGAAVKVRVVEPPFPKVFVRGDFDDDGVVNVADAVSLLSFLFQGGRSPVCDDAADVSDQGRIDVSSAVTLLNFLFAGGRAPAAPYPNKGLDPSEDAFGECLAVD